MQTQALHGTWNNSQEPNVYSKLNFKALFALYYRPGMNFCRKRSTFLYKTELNVYSETAGICIYPVLPFPVIHEYQV